MWESAQVAKVAVLSGLPMGFVAQGLVPSVVQVVVGGVVGAQVLAVEQEQVAVQEQGADQWNIGNSAVRAADQWNIGNSAVRAADTADTADTAHL
jgi:hypothetical protein